MEEEKKKDVLLQVRVPLEDKGLIEDTAKMYGLDVKQLVPLAVRYIAQQKPTLEISPLGKGFAPELQVA